MAEAASNAKSVPNLPAGLYKAGGSIVAIFASPAKVPAGKYGNFIDPLSEFQVRKVISDPGGVCGRVWGKIIRPVNGWVVIEEAASPFASLLRAESAAASCVEVESLPASAGNITNVVRFEGDYYATLDNRAPRFGPGRSTQRTRVPLPPCWEICPSDVHIAKRVIDYFPWATDVLFTRNGDGWCTGEGTREWRDGFDRAYRPAQFAGNCPLDVLDGAYRPHKPGTLCSILIRLLPGSPTLLTLHLEPQEDGTLAVNVTDMGGAEVAALQATPEDILGDQRSHIARLTGEAHPGLIQLLAPDGRLLTGADDPKQLAEIMASAQPQVSAHEEGLV